MALISVKCPSCGGDIQLDDTREFGFCINCGTKIMIHDEAQNIKVSGKVQLDTSENAANCIDLANKAFDIKDYIEAYNYYTKALEYDSSSYKAVFRKGLCAGYLSDEENIRTSEIVDGYTKASEMINLLISQGNSIDTLNAEHKTMTDELGKFALNYFGGYTEIGFKHKFNSREDAERFVNSAVNTTDMLSKVNGCIDVKYEDTKEKILSFNIKLCDKLIRYGVHIKYIESVSINDIGKETPEYASYFVSDATIAKIKALRAEAVSIYNNLPSKREGMKNLDDAIGKQQALIDEYDKSVSDFWNANHEKYKGYKSIGTQSVIFTIAGVIISSVLIYFTHIIGIIVLIISIFANIIIYSSRKEKYEKNNFSAEMLDKKAKNLKDSELLNAKKREKKHLQSTLKK